MSNAQIPASQEPLGVGNLSALPQKFNGILSTSNLAPENAMRFISNTIEAPSKHSRKITAGNSGTGVLV
jgi:hypothetical protein